MVAAACLPTPERACSVDCGSSAAARLGQRQVIIEDIVAQHAEEAAFLWLLRAAAVRAPHYDLQDLADLEERVEAHLDGLRVAGEAGWPFCADGLQQEECGEVFTAAFIALDADRDDWLAPVLDTVAASPGTLDGLVSALGWVQRERLKGRVVDWLKSDDPLRHRLGLAACTVQRVDCGGYLASSLQDADAAVRAAALRNVAGMRRRDLLPWVVAALDDEDADCRLQAAHAVTLLGESLGLARLSDVAGGPPGHAQAAALQLLLRALPHGDAVDWVRSAHAQGLAARHVVQATGIIGDPVSVPWLIEQMATPELARVAAEAFSLITGIDPANDDLESARPEGFEAGPSEDAQDDDVALDPDEDLAWPAPDRLAQWWVDHRAAYAPGTRYLCGRPIDADGCHAVLAGGLQRQRRAAALELALLEPARPVFNTSAPARRQRELLGLR